LVLKQDPPFSGQLTNLDKKSYAVRLAGQLPAVGIQQAEAAEGATRRFGRLEEE
jgi:hypothetical protein